MTHLEGEPEEKDYDKIAARYDVSFLPITMEGNRAAKIANAWLRSFMLKREWRTFGKKK
jgi:hypothetical protein